MADSLATQITNLQTIRDQLIARMIEVMASVQIDYSTTTPDGGESFTRSAYLRYLQGQLDAILDLLQSLQPFIISTRAYV